MVGKRTRFEVLRRDGHACRYCGRAAPEVKLTVDHVVPVALGGSDHSSNLVAACADCNAGKASIAPDAALVADVAETDLRWAAAMKRAACDRAAEREQRDDYVRTFDQAWQHRRWGGVSFEDGRHFARPGDWRVTAREFYAAGLPIDELLEAVEIACSKSSVHPDNAWRYMCGVAYRKLAGIHAAARELIAAEAV